MTYKWRLRRPERALFFVLLLCAASLQAPTGGLCRHTSDCVDGRGWCESGLACVDGWCRSIPGIPCSHAQTCDDYSRECQPTSCEKNDDCDDGLFCTGTEVCSDGICTEQGDSCEAGICDELMRVCTWPARMFEYMRLEDPEASETLAANATTTPLPLAVTFDLTDPLVLFALVMVGACLLSCVFVFFIKLVAEKRGS